MLLEKEAYTRKYNEPYIIAHKGSNKQIIYESNT